MRLLNRDLWFPDPRTALRGECNGLLAIGGDLSVERLLLAYRTGVFPWSADPITWWSPDPRAIFERDGFHLSRSLAKELRRGAFSFTRDERFEEVIRACAAPAEGRTESWISPEFIRSYVALHKAGHAHSVECWQEGRVVGGIYGVAVGGFFAGESMFHHADNASKAALHHLLEHLWSRGFALFDTQVLNPATAKLGATEISREEYLRRLKQALQLKCAF
ncbi:MAG TPA: leucyl/phenylalanyl-tRNA--protein transferase [Verrucomicrobiales bacterium]|nr:leucyl/phenylalanyl-tRNA--protein transferase [Verrucomicrobiales bacterium]